MGRLSCLFAFALVLVSGTTSCEPSEPNLDATRERLDHPTATLDADLAVRASELVNTHQGAVRGLVCGGYLYELVQRFVDRVRPGGSSDGGTSGDGGSAEEGLEVNGAVLSFSGDVWIDAPCPGQDGVFGTDDDGRLHADGTVRHAVLDPVWRANFRQCYYPTDCTSVAADGDFLLDLGQKVRPGETISLDNLVARYVGRVAAAPQAAIQGKIEFRKRADGIDLVIVDIAGRSAVLSFDQGGVVRLTTAEGTYTCDFPARRCTHDVDSHVFSW